MSRQKLALQLQLVHSFLHQVYDEHLLPELPVAAACLLQLSPQLRPVLLWRHLDWLSLGAVPAAAHWLPVCRPPRLHAAGLAADAAPAAAPQAPRQPA